MGNIKESPIGTIPCDWCIEYLKDISDIKTGPFGSVLHASDYKISGIPIITVEHLGEQGVEHKNLPLVGKKDYKRLLAYAMRMGDIVFSRVGSVDRNAWITSKEDGWLFSGRLLRVRTDNAKCFSRYLSYYLHYSSVKELVRNISVGQTMPSLNTTLLGRLPVVLPSTQEQTAIAELLSSIDNLIISLQKLIDKKKNIKQGAMQELLTGKRRLSGFNDEWNDYCVGHIGFFYSGLTGKSKHDFERGKARFITFLNVLCNIKIDVTNLEKVNVALDENQNLVQVGDLFFNTSSEVPEEVGMCATLLEELEETYLNSFCFGFRLIDENFNSLFLSYYFNSNIGRKIMRVLAQGATRYNLSKSDFKEITIKVPNLEEQIAIAQILSDMDNEIEQLEKKLAKYQQIKQGMMQELLTGHIRLVENEEQKQDKIQIAKEKATQNHNQHFDDAVMIAGIVNAFYSDKYLLGRKKIQKLLYLVRRKEQADISPFHKKAAGPYADAVRYKGGEPIAKKNKYIQEEKSKMGSCFSKGANIQQALAYLREWNKQQDIAWLVSEFQYTKVDELELLATVDMAMCDLHQEGKPITVQTIKDLIQSTKEWRDKLKKTYFSDSDIQRAIVKCRGMFKEVF